jgi:hypothetical protein
MIQLIAYYLPQYHPIKENDEWWGKGFTEWVNVAKTKPLFKGHEQPKIPADLGFYDLRCPETREEQANLAKKYGISGFCYWHYWFSNRKQLLERPFSEVLTSGKPDFPFCIAWANHTWSNKTWSSNKVSSQKILIEQQYQGIEDYTNHFYTLLSAFKDKRYIKIDNKPVFVIYAPLEHPEMNKFIILWQKLAKENALDGIYFIGHVRNYEKQDDILRLGFDAVNTVRLNVVDIMRNTATHWLQKIQQQGFNIPYRIAYSKAIDFWNNDEDKFDNCFPTIIPNWDHTPRSSSQGIVITGSTPELFKKHLQKVFDIVKKKPENRQIAFIKSWNEWGEGNYLEPDIKYGVQYLEKIRELL